MKYYLQAYNADNALRLSEYDEEGTLTLTTPVETSELFVLGTSGNGTSSITVTLNYSDGTSAEAGTYGIRDWSVRTEQLQGDEAVKALGNIRRDNNSYSSDNHYCLFDFSVPVDPEKQLVSVTVKSQSNAYASIMALSRIVEMPTGIDLLTASGHHADRQPTAVYSLGGMQQKGLKRGLNIIRYSDGTTKKVATK